MRDSAHDYTRLFELVDALNANDQEYSARVESLVDVESWMRTFALRHVVGDWDAYGYRRGKNMYAYRPVEGKWQLLDWDIAFAFGLGDGTDHDLFDATHFDGTVDVVTERMYNHPQFRRAYLRALYDIVHGPLEEAWAEAGCSPPISRWRTTPWRPPTPRDPELDPQPPRVCSRPAGGYQCPVRDYQQWRERLHGLWEESPRTHRDRAGACACRAGQRRGVSVDVDQRDELADAPAFEEWPQRPESRRLRFNRCPAFGGGCPTPRDLPGSRSETRRITWSSAKSSTIRLSLILVSSNFTIPRSRTRFDLSGFELRGTGFTFAEGTVIEPGGYLVVVSARSAFGGAFGYRANVAGVFPGRLRNDGETISLVRPGATPQEDVLIDRVTYSDAWPWPTAADGLGSSLQLVDPIQDNRRPGAWFAVTNNPATTTSWQFTEVTGVAYGDTLYIYLESSGEVYLDDICLVPGTVAQVGTNLVQNAGFEKSLAGTWTVSATDPGTRDRFDSQSRRHGLPACCDRNRRQLSAPLAGPG